MSPTRATAAAVLAAAILAPAALAQRSTTTPGVIYDVPFVITDSGIAIKKDKFTVGNLIRYPRGAVIRYRILNKGTKPYSVDVLGSITAPIKPGKRDTILVNFNIRGNWLAKAKLGGKVVLTRPIQVF